MNRWYAMCYVLAAVVLLLMSGAADLGRAGTVEIGVGDTAVAVGGGGSPDRHLMRFDLPECLAEAEIELAVVELTADVESDAGGVTLNAYAMTEDWEAGQVDWSSLTGGGEDEPFDRGRHAMWCVAAGEAMLVRLDVTEMVAVWTEDSSSNRGQVLVPSLGEQAMISPELAREGRAGEALLTVWYTPRAVVVEPDVEGLR